MMSPRCGRITIALLVIVSLPASAGAQTAAERAFARDDLARGRVAERHADACRLIREEPGHPFALYLLDRIESDAGMASDPDLAFESLSAAVASRAGDGFTRQLHRERLLHHLVRRGEVARVREMARTDGVARHWLIAGPFGYPAATLHDEAFDPELEISGGRAMKGAVGPVVWRAEVLSPGETSIFPAQSLGRRIAGCAYGLVQVHASAAQDVALTVRCGGSYKVWVSGALVADVDRARERSAKTAIYLARLGAGWNRILVKFSDNVASRASADLMLRITDPAGEPAPELRIDDWDQPDAWGARASGIVRAPAAAPEAAPAIPAPRRTPVEAALAALASDQTPAARLLTAWTLHEEGMSAEAWELVEPLAEDDDPAVRFVVANFLDRFDAFPEDVAHDRARRLVRQALDDDPDLAPAVVLMAKGMHEDDKSEDAIRLLQETRARLGDLVVLDEALAAVFDDLDWTAERLAVRRRQLGYAPHHARALSALRAHYENLGNSAAAARFEKRLKALDRDRLGAAWREFGIALTRGDLDEARRRFEGASRLESRPEVLRGRRIDLAEAEWRGGDEAALDRALAELDAAARERDERIDYLRRAARLLEDAGREEEARSRREEIVRRSPGARVSRAVATKTEEEHEAIFREFAVDPWKMIEASKKLGDEYATDSSVLLIDQVVTILDEDEYVHREIHQLFWLRDRNAVEQFGRQRLDGEVLLVRTILPDGSVLEPIGRSPYTMPGLKPGAFVEIKHRDRSTNRPDQVLDLGGFLFQDRRLRSPFHFTRWVVALPEKHRAELRLRNYEGEPVVHRRDGRIIYVMEKEAMERMPLEPHMPEPEELVPYADFFSRENEWASVNRAFLDDVMPVTVPTPAVREATREAVGETESDLGKARAIYDWVMREIVSGEGDARPDRVLHARRGLRLTLVMAMLRAADVDFRYARARSRSDFTKTVDWTRPWAIFDTPLIQLRPRGGRPLYIATDSPFRPFGSLPDDVSGAEVFLAEPGLGRIERLPEAPPEETAFTSRLTLVLEGEDASGRLRLRFPGDAAARLKEALRDRTRGQQSMFVTRMVGRQFAGLAPDVAGAELVGLDDRAEPLEMVSDCRLKQIVARSGGRLTLRAVMPPMGMMSSFVGGLARRFHPLVIPRPIRLEHRVEVHTGARYSIDGLPPSVLLTFRGGRYRLHGRTTPAGAVVERSVEILPVRIDPQEYADFVKFCRRIDDVESERIALREVSP